MRWSVNKSTGVSRIRFISCRAATSEKANRTRHLMLSDPPAALKVSDSRSIRSHPLNHEIFEFFRRNQFNLVPSNAGRTAGGEGSYVNFIQMTPDGKNSRENDTVPNKSTRGRNFSSAYSFHANCINR